MQVIETTTNITLHALDITIDSAEFHYECEKLKPDTINYSKENETASLKFSEEIPAGAAGVLYLTFTGELNDKMKGFYRSKYFTASGEERYAGVTQFEATDARRCFPCWDEPAIKATFDITLTVPKDRVALSNMPVLKEDALPGDLKRIRFDRTPVMSTYLVACVVGEYDYVEGKSEDGVIVRVFTPVGKREQGQFALDVATKVLPYYKSYFNIAYPLPKMDLIAISDFSAGAMENWGLVTYRETFVLVDPKNTSLMRKQSIALTVGHEIAHQWFGKCRNSLPDMLGTYLPSLFSRQPCHHGVVDSFVAQRGLRLLRGVPLRASSVPGVRYLDTVRHGHVHTRPGAGLAEELASH